MNDIIQIMAEFECINQYGKLRSFHEPINRNYKKNCMLKVEKCIKYMKESGFVIVPIEPDNAMQLAANDQYGIESDVRDEVCRIYKAMIESSQGGDV